MQRSTIDVFTFACSALQRLAAGCTTKLGIEPLQEYLKTNVVLMQDMIANKYLNFNQIEEHVENAKGVTA